MLRIRSRLRSLFGRPVSYARNINQRYYSDNYRLEFNPSGSDFFAADWDTLVILDGCRYDTFRKFSTLPGHLSYRESRGSMTVEFLRGNVAGRALHDTVYVTANGQFYNYRDELDASFHHVENIWQHDDAWSEDHHTVFPETTTAYALRAAERFPDKRLVVHYVQPHYPFIEAPIEIDDSFNPETPDFWKRVLVGDLHFEPAELRAAYEANLERALPHVADLLEELAGKTVVTADHGNMLGDRARPLPMREWGHPSKLWIPELTKVPWLVSVSHPRPEHTSEPPTANMSLAPEDGDAELDDSETHLREHLKHLGYTQ
jgi:hypothetical protein